MKTTVVRRFALMALLCVPGAFLRADAATYAQLLKERENVLSQILAQEEARRATGTADDEAVFAARLAVYSFRRDTAASKEEKLKVQRAITGLYEQRLAVVKSRDRAGLAGPLEVLRATDALLSATQVLEELQLGVK